MFFFSSNKISVNFEFALCFASNFSHVILLLLISHFAENCAWSSPSRGYEYDMYITSSILDPDFVRDTWLMIMTIRQKCSIIIFNTLYHTKILKCLYSVDHSIKITLSFSQINLIYTFYTLILASLYRAVFYSLFEHPKVKYYSSFYFLFFSLQYTQQTTIFFG